MNDTLVYFYSVYVQYHVLVHCAPTMSCPFALCSYDVMSHDVTSFSKKK